MFLVIHISRWRFQGDLSVDIAMTSTLTFSDVRSLDVTWWPLTFRDLGLKFDTMCGKSAYIVRGCI